MLDFVPVPRQFLAEIATIFAKYGLVLPAPGEDAETPEDSAPWEDATTVEAMSVEAFHAEFCRRLAVEIPQATQPELSQSTTVYEAGKGLLTVDDVLNYLHYLTTSRDATYNRHIIGLLKTLGRETGVRTILDLGDAAAHRAGMAETVRRRENDKLAYSSPPPPEADVTKGRLETRMRQILRGGG